MNEESFSAKLLIPKTEPLRNIGIRLSGGCGASLPPKIETKVLSKIITKKMIMSWKRKVSLNKNDKKNPVEIKRIKLITLSKLDAEKSSRKENLDAMLNKISWECLNADEE